MYMFFSIFVIFLLMEIQRTNTVSVGPVGSLGNITVVGVNGTLTDSGFNIDDKQINTRAIWSSKKVTEYVTTQLPQLTDLLDDTTVAKNKTWSSDQITSFIMELDDDNQSKVPSATNNNLAVFLAGSTVDSGVSIDDTKTPSSVTLYTSRKIDELLKAGGNGMIDDTKASKTTTWSSDKSEATYLKRFKAVDDEFAPITLSVINRDGTLGDSGVTINNLAERSDKVIYTSLRELKVCVLLDISPQALIANAAITPQVTVEKDDINQWNGQGFFRCRRRGRFLCSFRFFCNNASAPPTSQFVSVVFTKRVGLVNTKNYQFSFPQTALFMCEGSQIVDMEPINEITIAFITTFATTVDTGGTLSFHEL